MVIFHNLSPIKAEARAFAVRRFISLSVVAAYSFAVSTFPSSCARRNSLSELSTRAVAQRRPVTGYEGLLRVMDLTATVDPIWPLLAMTSHEVSLHGIY